MKSDINVDVVRKMLPANTSIMVSQKFLNDMVDLVKGTSAKEIFKDNFINYLSILQSGKYSLEEYAKAVMYVSNKLGGDSNVEAYIKVFYQECNELTEKYKDNEIEKLANAYNRCPLVVKIYEQTLVPSHILNAPLHQEALNKLADIIRSPNYGGMSKVKACEVLLQYTKQPEVNKSELKIEVEQNDTISSLREVTEQMAEMLRQGMQNGKVSLRDVTDMNIIDVN